MQEYLPIPLQQQQQFIPTEEKYLDFADLYSIYSTHHISSLYPDSATKMITKVWKDCAHLKDSIFTLVAAQIFKKSKENKIYYIVQTRNNDEETMERKVFKSGMFVDFADKPSLSNNTFIILSYQDNNTGFGHYCGVCIINNEILMYDSMMRNNGTEIESDYIDTFQGLLQDCFTIPEFMIFFKIDYYFQPSTSVLDFYSFEITGGELSYPNLYSIANFKKQNLKFVADSIILGSDGQNQYCWMWTLLYLLIKASDIIEWQEFQTIVWGKNIIPVSLIKLFISLVLKVESPTKLLGTSKSASFFKQYFNSILCNAPSYRETFDSRNKEFILWQSNVGTTILQSSTISFPDYFTCIERLIETIQDDQMNLETIPSVIGPQVVSSIMTWINQPANIVFRDRLEKYCPQATKRGQVPTQQISSIKRYKRWVEQFDTDRKKSDKQLQRRLVTRLTLRL
jgi:hypothetical protein